MHANETLHVGRETHKTQYISYMQEVCEGVKTGQVIQRHRGQRVILFYFLFFGHATGHVGS